ncbi:MAG: UDP-N-acetylglucosamine--N-acetylmuramyl-(pentapeptide) pyrophosphoryl-undecaprenol N-acetylglucosamine transferase [Actinobacteria bacterium]|nr:UDP-N-acetylglucosamine--N-acetylmuramyl-(pentapeptide) pyrophosphoryl-undecaprenol N-acetylglucosamine transferase [Actinomycetota bacterium]
MKRTPSQKEVLFAGGGTAGHVLPGVAVAKELVARGRPSGVIHFVGSAVADDRTLVEEAGFMFTGLPGRGIQRRFTLDNVRAIAAIVAGVFRGIALVRRMRPKVVVAIGSYAAVPCVVGAALFRVPIVVLARDARAGAADRLAGRFAKACAVPFESTDLPRAVVTGNPVRAEVLAVDRAADAGDARAKLNLPDDRVVVAVFTGSLGSRRVNTAVRGLVDRWADRAGVAIRHAVGRRDWAEYARGLPELRAGGLVYQPVEYEDQMELLLAAADVAVTRAGGATVAELAVVGLPAIMVPLPIATRDHQTANADALVAAGAGIRVPDDELDTDRLEAELAPLVDDAQRRLSMSAAALSVARRDAAAAVADLVERYELR